MKDVVIVSACRTAIGAFGGTLKDSHASKLAATAMKEAIIDGGRIAALMAKGDYLETWKFIERRIFGLK